MVLIVLSVFQNLSGFTIPILIFKQNLFTDRVFLADRVLALSVKYFQKKNKKNDFFLETNNIKNYR
jgi:hypothetical protein